MNFEEEKTQEDLHANSHTYFIGWLDLIDPQNFEMINIISSSLNSIATSL